LANKAYSNTDSEAQLFFQSWSEYAMVICLLWLSHL